MDYLGQSCLRGRTHQGHESTVLDLNTWTSDTIEYVLDQGDFIYRSVHHQYDYMEYTELPLSVCLPNSEEVLSCLFGEPMSGLMHANHSLSPSWSFTDAVSASCRDSLGCLVTVNGTTVAIMRRGSLYYLFDPHARDRLGLADGDGTAVLLQFGSVSNIHNLMKQLHYIADNAQQCSIRWPRNHDEHCQFDVVAVFAVSEASTPQVITTQGLGTPEVTVTGTDGKVMEEQHFCQLCNKSFVSEVALHMHTIKVHRKRKALVFTNSSFKRSRSQMHYEHSETTTYADVVKGKCKARVVSGTEDEISSCVSSVDIPVSENKFVRRSQKANTGIVRGKQHCSDCGKLFVNIANHKKCTKRLLKKQGTKVNSVPVCNQKSDVSQSNSTNNNQSDHVQLPTSTSADLEFRVLRHRKANIPRKQKGRTYEPDMVKNRYGPLSSCDDFVQRDKTVDTSAMHVPTRVARTRVADSSPRKKGASRRKGSTRKDHTGLQALAELEKLKKSCTTNNVGKQSEDPLLQKLTSYHNRLSSQVENILTEKVSAEVAEVLYDVSRVDDVGREFLWSKTDETKLNRLNAEARRLETPDKWTWAAKEGTDQFEYNHKRLQYFVEHELQTAVKHCDKCKSTGILVGIDQLDSEYCHDCIMQNNSNINKGKRKEKEQAWDSVRPKSMEYPKRIEPGHEREDLPRLYSGDKAVISPVHPIVTVRKNYFANKKLRQESITLRQDAEQTWCKILPRTELKDRFVVIERTSNSHTRKHIVANPESVAIWLRFLFKNHTEFVRKQKDGELQLSEAALRVLESQSELGEVLDDVEDMSKSNAESESRSPLRAVKSPESRVVAPVPPQSSGVLQAELESGFSRSDVFTFDKFPQLYVKAQDLLRIKQSGQIEVIDDRQKRVPIYNVSATMAFPYLYSRGEKSPLDFGDFKMSRYLLKKQTLFAYKMADAKYNWEYAQDDTHLMYQYARLVELMVNASATWYLQETPDVAHLPMDQVLQAFKNGFSEDQSLIDSKMPGLSSLMARLPNSRETWYAERLGIEAISRDFGDPNLFLTLSNDPRSTYDTRALLYSLQHGGAKMPVDQPYEVDTEQFTKLMSRYAPQMSIYLCRKTKMFLKAFLCDICGISEKGPTGDWTERDKLQEGFWWGRVEFTETRGVQHWHALVKLPHVLDTALIGRMIQNLRIVRQEMKCGNIKPGKEDAAWEIIEVGLLASRYATLFADSVSTASFYTEQMPTDSHDSDKVVNVDKLRQEYVQQYVKKDVSMRTHPIMRRFCDVEYCDENRYVEMAKVAAVSCVHNCIQTVCGGDEKTGKGCRFDFPKKNLNHTVPAVMQVNATQMEARTLLRRTCDRVPNLNQYFLLYWRTNHDVSVLIDAAHKMRYATKYAAKTGKYTELLNEIIEYLSQRSMDLIPTSMKHVLSQLLLADVSHRAFMSKQELSYRVMDLPVVRRTFANVDVVGFYRRSYISRSAADNHTIMLSDRTEYSAYAERCLDKTAVMNRKNAKAENILTKKMIAAMNFREFAETVSCEWHTDASVTADMADIFRTRRVVSREVNSGHWILRRRAKRRHIRFSTVLYTDAACEYEPVEEGETAVQPTFFSLSVNKRKQLYRAYMELVCYVPWSGSPEETFLDEEQRTVLKDGLQDPEKDHRYSLRRLEMFFDEYMRRWNRGEVAPVGSQWRRDNQYSYSMYLTTQHNVDIHMQRVENAGMLKARYEADDELRETGIDLRYDIQDEVDQSEYPGAMSFLTPDTFKELLDQKPPEMADISVAFPKQRNWQELEEMVKVRKNELFMAQPPACSVTYEEMTEVQKWAVDLGIDMNQKVLYLCGKAGCGKTQVALKVCELLSGRIQAAASTGKAASLLGAPTVHGMFKWGTYDRSQSGGEFQINNRKLTELRTFYENTDVFIVDEVNALSAAMLAQMHETMTALFNPNRQKDREGNDLPFGGKKVIFLGDPAQLKPVMGEPIYGEGSCTSTKPGRVRGSRGKRQVQYHQTSKGQELYRKYLAGNCVLLNRGQRNSGLLQQICDRLRDGHQTNDDRIKLAHRRKQFPDFVSDFTLHYENERCLSSNLKQLWSECSGASPTKRLYICRASYHTTPDNHSVVDGLAALPPQNFAFATDVLCVAVGCDVRLIKNVNVSSALVNSATGKVVQVIYDSADCTALLAGKYPPPYCIVVCFPGFRGFLTKTGQRTRPFPNQPQWVPIYREKFVAPRSELPSWIVKKQAAKDCWRMQFPLDLCRAMTCHRAQGQTMADCTVSVDLGLENPDRQLPQDICSILYVACTRVPRLRDLFVSPIHPSTWEKIGQSVGDVERRRVDEKLRNSAEEFAISKGKYKEIRAELDWKPDYSNCDAEWKDLQEGIVEPAARDAATVVVAEDDLLAESKIGMFYACLKPVLTERHIGLDQGPHNFAMVAIDAEVGKSPVVVAAENFNLQLKQNCKASEVVLKLLEETELSSWMQQTDGGTTQGQRTLPVVDRVVVHIEQMSVKNPGWKHFGVELGTLLQQRVNDKTRCIVKMSSPHLLRAGGVIHHLGSQITKELKLTPVTYGKKGRKPQRSAQTQLTDVEPLCSDDDSNQDKTDVDYGQKKEMSAGIFRYFMYADDNKQSNMGVSVVYEVQELWQERIRNDQKVKLDDVGDALLHGLNDILCGGSSYRQLVPSNVGVHCNRTVVIAVCPKYTYWVVVHCTWNIFIVEDVGWYETTLTSKYYKSNHTVADIKESLLQNVHAALTDMTGKGQYRPVDVIKMVVKQLKGFGSFKRIHAGALTRAVVTALREISDEYAGTNSMVSERKDKIIGSLYVRTNMATSQKFQVMSSAGKLTNAILSCFNWMSENATKFVEKRTFSVDEDTKLRFFNALRALASSNDERLELIQLSDSLKEKLVTYNYQDIAKKMLGYLILIGISKNEQQVKAISTNYRRSPVKSKVK